MFKKILIANRGEIALRIIRACKELGIRTVAVYSDADTQTLPVRYADEAVHIGPPLSRKSYLNMENILQAAKETQAEAIHPGYGFLSENAEFAEACESKGVVFIGPKPSVIRKAGDKSAAKNQFRDLGIPVIPGSKSVLTDIDEAMACAGEVGYPVILKASGGGGGRGMRLAQNGTELKEAYGLAAGEAAAAFGNSDLYLEKYIVKPRHVEIQILSDKYGKMVHLGERECSIQKRHQKLIEETPSPFIDPKLREEMGKTAIAAAGAIGYTNAGTIEFLMDSDKRFYFMEVNARVQVEHPVTELISGIDIVQEQIKIAFGEPLTISEENIRLSGWAMECRINAANPDDNFMPSPGEIESLILPGGPGVRVDTHIFNKEFIPPFYDSLIAKLCVWAPNRRQVIARMERALEEFEIGGIKTTIPFYQKILKDPDFQKGNMDTHFLDRF